MPKSKEKQNNPSKVVKKKIEVNGKIEKKSSPIKSEKLKAKPTSKLIPRRYRHDSQIKRRLQTKMKQPHL